MWKAYQFIVFLFLLIQFACSNVEDADPETGRRQAMQVLDDFIKAHETKNLDLLLSCFSDNPNILILGTDENELWIEKNAFGKTQERAYNTFEKVKLSVRDKVLNMSEFGKTAWFYMRVNWFVESGGEKFKFNDIRTTGVLQKEKGFWKIVQLHTSLPVEGQAVKY